MESIKLRLKIGSHEFEAEGPPGVVSSYFESWKAEIAGKNRHKPDPAEPIQLNDIPLVEKPENEHAETSDLAEPGVYDWRLPKASLTHLFAVDGKRGLVRLRALPTGEDAEGKAALLALYGALRLKQEDELRSTRLIAALEDSGMNPERLDRAAAREIRERWITRHGKGKGGRYRLTTTGIAKAEELGAELAKQFV